MEIFAFKQFDSCLLFLIALHYEALRPAPEPSLAFYAYFRGGGYMGLGLCFMHDILFSYEILKPLCSLPKVPIAENFDRYKHGAGANSRRTKANSANK